MATGASALVLPGMARAETTNGWQSLAPTPAKVQEIYPTACNGKIHLAGGLIAMLGRIVGDTDKHFVYDPAADEWTSKRALPQGRHHPNLVTHKDTVYALGGFHANGPGAIWDMQDQSWVYDEEADSWADMASAPARHGETVCASIGAHIHVVGGRTPKGDGNKTYRDHVDTDHHMVFDPAANVWADAAPALTKRNSAAGTVIDGLFYIVGGRTVTGGNVADLEIYDTQEDKWRTGAPMPQAQGGLAAAALDGKLYAFGGEYFNNGGGVYPEVWVYNPATDEWAASEPMKTPRHGLGAVTIDGWIYTVGGAKKASGNDTANTLERFRPVK
jgi:N-acetylneuraminic acid mutarotase